MKSKQQKIEFVSDEKKSEYLKLIIAFFDEERNEEIGFIAAENILNFFINSIGEEIYQKALYDIRKALKEKLEDLDIELDLLIQR